MPANAPLSMSIARLSPEFSASVRRFREVAGNYLACAAFLTLWVLALVGLAACPWTPQSLREVLNMPLELGGSTLFGTDVILAVYAAYLVGLVPYYFTLPPGHVTKCRRVWEVALGRRPVGRAGRTAMLALAVKGYYVPLMSVWMAGHLNVVGDAVGRATSVLAFFDVMTVLHLLFLVDVAVYLFGYCVEHPKLGNEIRSVEPTVFGWLVALVCYPPLRQLIVGFLLENPAAPVFPWHAVQAAAVAACLALFGVYVWASLALGGRASNLTNRGIVTWGPYRWIRHPAYAAKNFAWWVGALSLIAATWGQFRFAVAVVFSAAGWSVIYYLRAVTEERHLSRDPDYREYCRRTPYRFVPGVV